MFSWKRSLQLSPPPVEYNWLSAVQAACLNRNLYFTVADRTEDYAFNNTHTKLTTKIKFKCLLLCQEGLYHCKTFIKLKEMHLTPTYSKFIPHTSILSWYKPYQNHVLEHAFAKLLSCGLFCFCPSLGSMLKFWWLQLIAYGNILFLRFPKWSVTSLKVKMVLR